MIEMWSGIDSL